MAFPNKQNFIAPAYRSAWFVVDTIWTRSDGSRVCQAFVVQTEGLQAVIEIQNAARALLRARKSSNQPIPSKVCGGQTIVAPSEVYVNGRIDGPTVAALVTLGAGSPTCQMPQTRPWRSWLMPREVSLEFLVTGLNMWVRNDARLQGEMARLMGGPVSNLFVIGAVLQPDAIPPFFNEPPSTPRHILMPGVTIQRGIECTDDPTMVV